jgi:hypothetical protein
MNQIIAKCKSGHVVRGTSDDVYGGWIKCGCGREAIAKWMTVVVSEKKCGAVCKGATGPSCSCECGGENHGGSKVAA